MTGLTCSAGGDVDTDLPPASYEEEEVDDDEDEVDSLRDDGTTYYR